MPVLAVSQPSLDRCRSISDDVEIQHKDGCVGDGGVLLRLTVHQSKATLLRPSCRSTDCLAYSAALEGVTIMYQISTKNPSAGDVVPDSTSRNLGDSLIVLSGFFLAQ